MSDAVRDISGDGCDCHVHIYDFTRFPLASTSTYGPPQATWNDYLQVRAALGLRRAVLVQPTGYGFDNACLLDALDAASQWGGDIARGIAVIAPETSTAELAALHARGIRGVRFMMIPGSGGVLGWDALELLDAKIAAFGWVINLQLDGRSIAEYEARLKKVRSKLSIDHIGKFLEPVPLSHPGFVSLMRLLDAGNTWVKLSAPYETSKRGAPFYEDVSALAMALAKAHPERCLWSSNWPHPGRSPAPDDAAMLDLLTYWVPDAKERARILVENPAALYGFEVA